jgi:hypothetical protein
MGISRDYPLKTRTSKQPIREISGFEIIPSHPLKYPRSKQGLKEESTVDHILMQCVYARKLGTDVLWDCRRVQDLD